MADRDNQVMIEDAQIAFRNFAGKEDKFSPPGTRTFAVFLDDETADVMEQDGWNVKRLNLRDDAEEGETPQAFIKIAVSYKGRPPKIAMITSGGRTMLDESTVEMLDWADITKVDLIFVPYEWEVNGNRGIKAYLKTMFVTIEEDELEKRYAENQTPEEDEFA